jgi:hypothetical protein
MSAERAPYVVFYENPDYSFHIGAAWAGDSLQRMGSGKSREYRQEFRSALGCTEAGFDAGWAG